MTLCPRLVLGSKIAERPVCSLCTVLKVQEIPGWVVGSKKLWCMIRRGAPVMLYMYARNCSHCLACVHERRGVIYYQPQELPPCFSSEICLLGSHAGGSCGGVETAWLCEEWISTNEYVTSVALLRSHAFGRRALHAAHAPPLALFALHCSQMHTCAIARICTAALTCRLQTYSAATRS